MPLDLFQAFFLCLSFLDWPSLQEKSICATGAVRGERVGLFQDRRVGSLVSEVPIALTAKIEEANVISSDFANNFSVLFDLSPDIVLLLKHVGAVVVGGFDSVGLVFENDLVLQLMAKSAHEKTIDLVLGVAVRNHSAIFKNDFTVSQVVDCRRLHPCPDRPLHMSRDFVVLVRYHEARDGWMVGDLLQVDLRAVLALALECLPQDWVQWLLEALVVDGGRDDLCNHVLHSFDRVLGFGGQANINRNRAQVSGHDCQSCVGRHALDGETDASQVELSVEDFAASCLFKRTNTGRSNYR